VQASGQIGALLRHEGLDRLTDYPLARDPATGGRLPAIHVRQAQDKDHA